MVREECPAQHTMGETMEGMRDGVLTEIYLGLEFVVDDFEQLDDVRVLALLHDSDLLANLFLCFTDHLREGGVAGVRHLRLASKPVQPVQTGICPLHDLHRLDWKCGWNEMKSGIYATHDMFVIVPGVFTEPDLAMLTFPYLPTDPVLVYHPHLTLTNGVHLVGDSNRRRVTG